MKKNSLFPGLLASLLLLSSLASCGTEASAPAENAESTDNHDGTSAVTEAAETEETRTPHRVPTDTLDFGQEEYHMHSVYIGDFTKFFFANEENGDVMNDAIYHRKRKVEEALNVKIVSDYADNYIEGIVSDVKKSVQAGDDDYDQVFIHCITGVAALASGGFLYNIDLLPYIDMNAEWWNRRQMDELRLGKNTYYAVNDFMIPGPYCIIFNKDIVRDNDMENPYQLVYDGKWTIDAFSKMALSALSDLDGDGKFTSADRYGVIASDNSRYISFVLGADQYITKRTNDGKIELALNTPKMQSLFETFAMLSTENVFYKIASDEDPKIDDGRALFLLDSISNLQSLRDCPADIGFLPYPKFDEEQEDYISLDWGGLSCVPTTVQNTEMIGAVMELLAWESKNEVLPTFYETLLAGKLARDEDSVKMLDILFDTIAYEIGGNYFGASAGFGELFYALPYTAINKKSADLASLCARLEKSANSTINSFYKSLDKAENN